MEVRVAARKKQNLYVGVDVGGTKTMAALVAESGEIIACERTDTPRGGTAAQAVDAVCGAIAAVLEAGSVQASAIRAVGLAVAGVVDPAAGRVVVTPNMNLSGVRIVEPLEQRFGVPVVLGNDVNMGTLGEKWLGAAQNASSAVGIFVGTGIGGGVVMDGKIVHGCRESAGEVGHIVMQMNGPKCGCGNRGCLEALASRTAIERDIRDAIAAGRKTIITDMLDESDGVIKSKMLKKALKAGDPLVTEVMRRASEVLGCACLTVRHLLDPDVIVLGGGVIEACGKFMMPIVRDVVDRDALPGARPGSYVTESELGDDAVVLGAVALAQQSVGADPLEDALKRLPKYPTIDYAGFGEVSVGGEVYKSDIYIRGDGKIKERDKKLAREKYGSAHKIGPEELAKVCIGHPALVVIGMGQTGMAALTPEGENFLRQRGIECQALPNQKALKVFNRAGSRKAAIIHVTC
jgi:glucokinase